MKATSGYEIKPKKISMEEKLKILGISDHEFQFFFELFVQNPQRYMIKKDDEPWQVIKSKTGKFIKLHDHVVAYHLLGKYWLGVLAPEVPWYLCIDIDASESLPSIYRIVSDWVSHPIVFQSSDSKGLHVYAFRDFYFPISANKLIRITSTELQIRGVKTAPGICEVFPAPNKFLRLPLGKGSCLLDPNTLIPMDLSLRESIEFIRENLRRHSFEELFPGLYRKIGRPNAKF
jgi:hypothetical protein